MDDFIGISERNSQFGKKPILLKYYQKDIKIVKSEDSLLRDNFLARKDEVISRIIETLAETMQMIGFLVRIQNNQLSKT